MKGGFRGICVAPLLGLQHEAPLLVEVDPAGAREGGAVAEGDGPLEDVGVVPIVGLGRFGARDPEEVAQFGEEELVVGALGRAGGLPAAEEIGYGGGGGCFGHGVPQGSWHGKYRVDERE